jgi:hypothetical protein
MDDFKKIIEGKNVLLLGPASYLYDGSYKEDLNKYDIVVKINRMVELEICKNFINDRCDILYHCINVEKSIGEKQINFSKIKKENVRMLRIAYPPVNHWYSRNLNTYQAINEEIKFPTTMVDSSTYKNLVHKCGGSSPNTGTIAIYDLFLQDPKTLTIKGITMFSGGYNKNYRTKVVTEKEIRDLNSRVKNHNIDFQKNFLKKILKYDKIIVDQYLMESVYGN